MSEPKKVIITGVSRGLGRSMVEGFVSAGWTVAGCARSAKAVKELSAKHHAPHFFATCDVADEKSVTHFCGDALKHLGSAPDLLVNNAALINANAPLWKVSAKEFSEVVDVNIKGTAAMIRHAAPAMLQRGGGVIVNFSSGWGRSTSAEVAPYCATKWAVEGLSQAMAQETGGKVAVVALNPGIIDTEMLRSCFGESAGGYPDAEQWAKRAVPYLIKLGAKDNGRSLTVA
jgi:NAD(P)-dependent dehydrogenase (short-subunit alcohol dehydrogenase family)